MIPREYRKIRQTSEVKEALLSRQPKCFLIFVCCCHPLVVFCFSFVYFSLFASMLMSNLVSHAIWVNLGSNMFMVPFQSSFFKLVVV